LYYFCQMVVEEVLDVVIRLNSGRGGVLQAELPGNLVKRFFKWHTSFATQLPCKGAEGL
jgi:hypothetical protein